MKDVGDLKVGDVVICTSANRTYPDAPRLGERVVVSEVCCFANNAPYIRGRSLDRGEEWKDSYYLEDFEPYVKAEDPKRVVALEWAEALGIKL